MAKKFLITIVVCVLLSSLHNLSIFCNASESEVEDESPFTYKEGSERGPEKWGEINPKWKICGNGKMQSPIDLLDTKLHISPILGKLKRDYKPAHATVMNRGHDITVEWKGYAGKININGTYYHLKRCHWHTPSEHTFNGSRYDLELHIIHESSDQTLAVIAILYKIGHSDRFLTRLFHHIKFIGKDEKHIEIVNPGDIKFGSRKYYRYIGSLTVPPCTEGIVWTISRKVRTVSREQVRALKNAVHDGFQANARPTQQLNGRGVWLYSPSKRLF